MFIKLHVRKSKEEIIINSFHVLMVVRDFTGKTIVKHTNGEMTEVDEKFGDVYDLLNGVCDA